jgi:acetyl-CoA synthetase
VPLSFLFGPDALEYRLDNSEARVAFVDAQSLPNLAPVRGALAGCGTSSVSAGVRGDGVQPFADLIARAADVVHAGGHRPRAIPRC